MSQKTDQTLSQLLEQKGQLPVQDALAILTDMLETLKTEHQGFRQSLWQQERVGQPCFTPDHIRITYPEDRPKAVFQQTASSEQAHLSADVSAYCAPEFFWDICLPASDIFSAGVILYQMITGRHPWTYPGEDEGPETRITRIFSARKTPPSRPSVYNDRCDESLDEIVLKAIATDLEDRYKNADEFLSALNTGKKALDTGKHPASMKLREKPIPIEKKTGKGFGEVAGMEDLKSILHHDVILPLKEKSLYEEYKVTVPNGLLLYGPPGCGKTFISQKFAEEIDYNFVEIRPSDLASIYVHGTQEKIGQLFREAREKSPSIIFIDEVDAILPSRQGHLYHSYASEVNEFLAQMTECHEDGVFVIAATNRPEKIDPAILRTGRMDKVVYVAPPDPPARAEMFRLYLEGRPTDPDIGVEALAEMTENYVSSDIKFMVNEASRNALKQRAKITQQHLENVISDTPPSVSQNQIQQYEAFKNRRVFA